MDDEELDLTKDDEFDYENGSSIRGKDALAIFLENERRYPTLTKEKNEELLREYHSAGEEDKQAIMDKLVEGNLKLVTKEAFRIAKPFRNEKNQPNNGLVLDFIQEGSEGLVRAVEKFDLSKGFAFSTFASAYIKTAILSFLNNNYRMIRIPKQITDKNRRIREAERRLCDRLRREPDAEEIASELNDGTSAEEVENIKGIAQSGVVLSMDQKRQDDDESDNLYREIPTTEQNPQEYAESKELQERLNKLMEELPEAMRFILIHSYPEDGSEPWTLQKIGEELNLSAERVRQIREEAKLRLIKALR